MTEQHYKIPDTMPNVIFRAYDIRGVVEKYLTPDVVYTIGLAIGTTAKQAGDDTVIVGRDGRLSGPELVTALIAGIKDSGQHVINIGAIPSPVLYFATHHLAPNAGVMLTGSHNPSDYNGLKMIIGGKTLQGDAIQELYQRIQNRDFTQGQGKETKVDVVDNYIQRILSDITLEKKMKVVLDCGNGIPGLIAPRLFKEMGCDVVELFCDVDGRFPNHHPDPTVPENLQQIIATVIKEEADIGLAFDGDGDRLGVVTNKGEIIWPDRQMMLLAYDVLSRNNGGKIIFDVKCSNRLADVIQENGGEPIMWKTGHSLIKKKLLDENALFAGEMSGHIFFKERWYGFDDALYTGARTLEIIAAKKEAADDIFKKFPNGVNTPELKVNIDEDKKVAFMEAFAKQSSFDDAQITTIDGIRVDFSDGWGLVRYSNTTPCLTVRFEADSEHRLNEIKALFREQLLSVDDSLHITF